jgi:lysyl-tRNA synthetase class 2
VSHRLSASRDMLARRARMLASTRAFFAVRGVLEVETPALSTAGTTDPAVDPVTAHLRTSAMPCYLHTSPEHAMKRLLAAGSGDIYQLCRVFRDGEIGRWHQPEFTLLEWYRVGWDEHRLMDEVEALLGQLLADRLGRPASKLRYADAFAAALGAVPDAPVHALTDALRARGIDAPADLTHDAALDLALSCAVAPGFDPAALTFIYDFPATAAALAEINPTDPPTAARFEVFCGGIELANGFRELTDAAEQRRRFEAELERRRAAGRQTPPIDEALLAALDRLPPSAGVAVGFDRVVALAGGADDVAAALSFVWESESP